MRSWRCIDVCQNGKVRQRVIGPDIDVTKLMQEFLNTRGGSTYVMRRKDAFAKKSKAMQHAQILR